MYRILNLARKMAYAVKQTKIVSISRMINKRPDNTSNSLEDALIDGHIWADIIRVPGTTLMDAHHNRIVVSNMRLVDQL